MVGFVKKGGLIDNSKKGQITIFIILGLVILFIAGFFIFYIQEAEKPMGKEPGELPTEFLQVENFIEECLYDTSIDAFELLGSNGGYINPQEYFTKKIEPTESEVLEFSPGSELWLPYWWYLDSGNDCIDDCSFASNRPALTRDEGGLNIEEMLDEYIETHLSSCINDFSALSGEFEIVETGEIEVETIIAENDVLIDLSYPIEIESMKSKGEYSRFRATLDIDFRKIYEFATDLTNAEAEGNFLEYNLMNLMASYSGMESHLLPPMEGTKFEFGSSVFWLDTDIKSNMEEMLMSYVPIFRVAGTKNYNPNFASGEDPLTRGLFNQFVLVMENKTYPTLNVNFNYLAWWPIYLYITPNQGGLLSPSGLFNTYMPFLGIQRFRFVYDVGYPVLVEITDDNAFHGDGYTFMVALESNIINNMPINVSKIPLQMISASGGQSMVCNLNQRNSGNITINIVDGESDLPLADVSIYFNLGTESCIIGQTDVNGNFVGKFPIGLGELNLQKFDYEHYIMPYFTKLAREDEIDIVLEPYRYKNVSIVKKTLGKSSKMGEWSFIGDTIAVDDNEEVILMLSRVQETPYSAEVSVPVYIKGNNNTEVRILPGEYEISGQVILKENVTILEDERCSVDIVFCWDTYDIDGMELEQSVSGGVEFNNETPNMVWQLTAGNLDSYDEIIFNVLSFSLKDIALEDRVIEDLSLMVEVSNFSQNNRLQLEPTYR